MPKFFGKNTLTKPSSLLSERSNFYANAYEKDSFSNLDKKPIENFNIGENILYGRIDQNLNNIYPNSEFIVPITRTTNQESAPRVLDFVADMFLDLTNNFERACRLQIQRSDDPYLSTLKAYSFYTDPEIEYRDYIGGIMRDYYKNHIISGNRTKSVLNIQQFINEFTTYLKSIGQYYPATFSGFMNSNQSSIFNSGLAISIAPLNIGDDTAKEQFFINNSAFDYYLNLCKNIGFSVSKNSPWVLVADLDSPAIKPYLARYNLFSVKDVFNKRFKQAHLQDLEKISLSIITHYREFVNIKPYEKFLTSCNDTTITDIEYRQLINNNTINYVNNNILDLYCNIKNIEERNILDNSNMNRLIRDALKYEKILSEEEVLNYINETFVTKRPYQDGSFYSLIQKQKLKKDLTDEPESVTNISSLFSGGY